MSRRLTAAYRALFEKAAPPSEKGATVSPLYDAMFRPQSQFFAAGVATASTTSTEDTALIRRIIAAYHRAQELPGDDGSFWSNHYGGLKSSVHETLMRGDFHEIANVLRNPAGNNLFYGFDGPYLEGAVIGDIDDPTRQIYYDLLSRLAEALGVLRTYYPEAPIDAAASLPAVDQLLDGIEQKFGAPLRFPNIYPSEQGLLSSRGIVTWRPLQAIYQAFKIIEATGGGREAKIVEIGAGLGRNVFYASSLGGDFRYTIVDLPLTNVAQAYFLGRTVGEEKILLFGETDENSRRIRIMPPEAFYQSSDTFDLAFNADSFTEMSESIASDYIERLSKRSARLLSINHEHNLFTINELCSKRHWTIVERTPYWMRKGYVQEMISFESAQR